MTAVHEIQTDDMRQTERFLTKEKRRHRRNCGLRHVSDISSPEWGSAMLQNLADTAKKTKFQKSAVIYIRLRKYSKKDQGTSRFIPTNQRAQEGSRRTVPPEAPVLVTF